MKRSMMMSLGSLLLAACATTAGNDPDTAGDPAAEAQKTFAAQGFWDDDVARMAAYMGGDIPQSPQLQALAGRKVQIVVGAQNMRVAGNDVVLDRQGFARQLLTSLNPYRTAQLEYVTSVPRYSASRDGGGGGSRGGQGSRGGSRSAESFLLDCEVSRLPVQANGIAAQRYACQVINEATRTVVWASAVDMDAPGGQQAPGNP